MTKLNKKIILILSVSLIFIVILLILKPNKKNNNQNAITPIKPNIEQNYGGKFSITLSINKNQFIAPEKLPFLEFETSPPPLTKDYANRIATNLNFSGEPTTINDPIDGTTYFWKNNNATLFVYSDTRKIRYGSNILNSDIDKQLTEKSILSLAHEYISKNNILEDNSFQLGSIKYLRKIPNGEGFEETTEEQSILYQVSILPKTLSYEIVSLSSVEPSSYIQIKQDGTIYSIQITTFPTLKNGFTEYKLKNYDELQSSLESAILIELRLGPKLLNDLSPNLIESVEINKIDVVYLLESQKSTYLQPIFKLTGLATLRNSTYKDIATLYLPALSQNQP